VVAETLQDYFNRHPRFRSEAGAGTSAPVLLTTGEPAEVSRVARIFWPDAPAFRHLAV
jgi:glutamate racemase